jgi:ligand-binding sensor domain-containing protein
MPKLIKRKVYQVVKRTLPIRKIYQGQLRITLVRVIGCLTLLLGISCSALPAREKSSPVSPSPTNPMNPKNVEAMAWQGDAYLWVGSRDGAARLNRTDGSVEIFDGIGCTSIVITNDQESIWCNKVGNAYRYDEQSWHKFEIDAYQIVEASDRILWAGTLQGLSHFDSEMQKWVSLLEAPEIASHFIFTSGPGIHLSFVASDGALWFYSFSEPYVGTTRWTEDSIQTWQPAGKWTIVQPKLETRDGTVWGIGDESVIARWDGRTWQVWQPFRLRPTIGDLIETQDGSIWVLAVADGVGRWDGQTWKIWSRDETILQDCPGAVKGKECFSTDSDVKYYLTDGLGKPDSGQPRLNLTALLETQDGNIWVGTAQEGISRWDGNKWRNYSISDGLSSESITAFAESPDGILWAGTRGGGVNYYDQDADRWQTFP